VQAQVVDLTDLEPQPGDLALVLLERGLAAEHVDQRLPHLVEAVQALERRQHRHRRRVADQRRLVGGDRLALIHHLVLEQLARGEVDLGALDRVLLGRGLPRQRLDQLAPRAALALQLGQRRQRADVGRIDAQRLLHRVDRVVDVGQVLAVPAADLDPQVRGLAAVARLQVADLVGVLAQQLLPAVGGGGQALQLDRRPPRSRSRA
jgi:hypothetical protein